MIGIIILTYNNWEETKRCIESIVNFPPEEDYHIYCIDNGSSVRSPFDFEKQYGKQILTLICTGKNLGYAAGNNVGIKEALQDGCEWLVISNNDIVFCENAISGIIFKKSSTGRNCWSESYKAGWKNTKGLYVYKNRDEGKVSFKDTVPHFFP